MRLAISLVISLAIHLFAFKSFLPDKNEYRISQYEISIENVELTSEPEPAQKKKGIKLSNPSLPKKENTQKKSKIYEYSTLSKIKGTRMRNPGYPALAIERKMEGPFRAIISFDGNGRVYKIEPYQKTGFSYLDDYVQNFISRWWRIPDKLGSCQVDIRFIFTLE